MPQPNNNFKLSVSDIDLIEVSLRSMISESDPDTQREINELLGRIHHQKIWYRPKKYIGG
jgi:hypothetical protein